MILVSSSRPKRNMLTTTEVDDVILVTWTCRWTNLYVNGVVAGKQESDAWNEHRTLLQLNDDVNLHRTRRRHSL